MTIKDYPPDEPELTPEHEATDAPAEASADTMVEVSQATEAPREELVRVPDFRRLGVFTAEMMRATKGDQREPLVDGVLVRGSVNIAVGDSGLGKTPLLVSMGICVASGCDWMGRAVQRGPVLFVDGESPFDEFREMVYGLSQFHGLPAPPKEFYAFSPNWGEWDTANALGMIESQIKALRPALVIVDPLRVFWSGAEAKSDHRRSA